MSATETTFSKTTTARLAALSEAARAELHLNVVEALEARLAKYADKSADERVALPCWKCGGRGYGSWPVDEGRCWGCNATGTHYKTVRTIRASIRRDITEEFKSAERVVKVRAERAQKSAAFAADNADLVEALNGREDEPYSFLGRMAADLASKGELTPKQADAARKALAVEAERKAAVEAAEPVPAGRVEVVGKIVSTKAQESRYGTTYKMLVLDDRGFKVFGTIPAQLDGSLADMKGERVRFTGTLEPSGDDPKFGFFSRPTKAAYVD